MGQWHKKQNDALLDNGNFDVTIIDGRVMMVSTHYSVSNLEQSNMDLCLVFFFLCLLSLYEDFRSASTLKTFLFIQTKNNNEMKTNKLQNKRKALITFIYSRFRN